MFCKNCGRELEDSFNVCPYCGNNIHSINKKEDIEHLSLYKLMSFFVPIAGLILFIIWNDEKPTISKACGKWALISVIIETIIGIIFLIIWLILFNTYSIY